MTARLEILKKSLINKTNKFDDKLQNHFDDVKSGNGQPMNDKKNGRATLSRWEKQNDALRNQQREIEKTQKAIEREEGKIIEVESAKNILPNKILELIEEGILKQWRKHPTILFVDGVDKARLQWVEKEKILVHRYVSEIKDKEQWKKFATIFNDLKKQINE
jgi:hypothetical protein